MDILHSIVRRVFGGLLITQVALAAAFPIGAMAEDIPDLLSVREPAAAARVAGNGDSVSPQVDRDGRFIHFSSSANDLVTNDNGHFGLDAFLHDRASNTTVLASFNWDETGGGNGNSIALGASTNGRFSLFKSDASDLLVGDTNDASDIFVRDMELGTNMLVSVAADGGWANDDSTEAVMTPDGRWIAFVCEATNLVADDTNGLPDLFLRDLLSGTTTWVTTGATGTSAKVSAPVVTPDGRYVVFHSSANGVVPAVPATSNGEVYLYDAVLDSLTWVSTNAAATALALLNLADAPSYHPVISDDGRYVAFKTGWTNGLVTPPSSGKAGSIVFVYDSDSGSATILSTNAFPPWANSDDVYGPEMSPDGRFVAYVERETMLATNYSSVRLWDRVTGTNVVVSLDQNGQWPTNTVSSTPSISDDGRYVAFISDAPNLVSNTVAVEFHIYRRDIQTGTNVLVDAEVNGVGSGGQFGVVPSMSGNGGLVTFASLDGNLVQSDDNQALDVLVWDPAAGTNQLISERDASALSVSGNGASSVGEMSISADGGLVAFTSFASDLVTNDFNQEADVFVRNQYSGETHLVSVGLDGSAASGGESYSPFLSSDGRYLIFLSMATNLVAENTDYYVNLHHTDVFLRDLAAGTTTVLSVDGNPLGNDSCSSACISQDGRYVAFVVQRYVYWRDLVAGVTRQLGGTASSFPISMSADGQRVAYIDSSSHLYVWDWNASVLLRIYAKLVSEPTSALLSANGNRLLYVAANHLYVRELSGPADMPLYPTSDPVVSASQWSDDGRFLSFVTDSGLVAEDTNGLNDVYLHDFQTSALTLVSRNQAGTSSAAGASDSPVLSADGRFVLFRSLAADVVPGMTGSPSLVMYDRIAGTNRLIITGTAETILPFTLARPLLSASGAKLAFQSWNQGLIANDLNRAGDTLAMIAYTGPALDSDGDGIPDWWMNLQFGHPTGEAGDLSQAGDDADGDGLTTLEEFNAGTNPRSLLSLLATYIRPDTNGTVAVSWDTVPGKSYQLMSATNMMNPVWEVYPGGDLIHGYQGSVSLQSTGAARYFRVESSN